jgi:hypothetical protein
MSVVKGKKRLWWNCEMGVEVLFDTVELQAAGRARQRRK